MTKKIKIGGTIVSNEDAWFYEWMDMEATSARTVTDILDVAAGENVDLTINSYGGAVDAGNEIYTALKNYPGKITAEIIMAGSAASIIAMGANVIKMSPVGQMMIHNVSMGAGGDYHEMDKASEILQKANQSLAQAYILKTGKSEEEILSLMDKETWLTAQEAVEKGFADEILFTEAEHPMLAANFGSGLVSPKIVDEMKRLKMENEKLKEKPKEKVAVSPFERFLF